MGEEALEHLRGLSNRVARLRTRVARMQSTQSQLVRNGGVRHDVVALNGNDYLVDGRVANEARSLMREVREVKRNRNRQQSRRLKAVWRSADQRRNRSRTTMASNSRASFSSGSTSTSLREIHPSSSASASLREILASNRQHRTSRASFASGNTSTSLREMHPSGSASASSLETRSGSSARTRTGLRSYLSDVLRPSTSDLVPPEGTQSQLIRRKLERMTLTPGSKTDIECKHRADTCAICIAPMSSEESCVLLPCRHVFHRSCLSQWVLRRNSQWCPMCKRPI